MGRVPDDLGRHAQIARDEVEWLGEELAVRRLLHVAPDEVDAPDVLDARVGPSLLESYAVQIHADHVAAHARGDEGEASVARPHVEHVAAAEVLVPELVEEHGPQLERVTRRVPPEQAARLASHFDHGRSSGLGMRASG